MKKSFIIMLCIPMLLSVFPTNVMAASTRQQDYEGIIKTIEMQPEESGGIYFVDGVLHVVPTKDRVDSLNRMIGENTRSINSQVIVDESVDYSLSELEAAFLLLREHARNLNLISYGIDIENNRISIRKSEWKEQEKQQIVELLNMKNIAFVSVGEVVFQDEIIMKTPEQGNNQDNMETDKDNLQTRAVRPKAYIGYELNKNGNANQRYTIGRAVEDSRGDVFFVTAGHGLRVGDDMYVGSTIDPTTGDFVNGLLGTVVDVKASSNVDAALIESADNFRPTGLTNKNIALDSDSLATQGGYVMIWTRGEPVKAVVSEYKTDVDWNGTMFYDMVEMIALSGNTEGGDSGAGVSRLWDENDFEDQSYMAIYKGRADADTPQEKLYATNRRPIEIYFDVLSIQEP